MNESLSKISETLSSALRGYASKLSQTEGDYDSFLFHPVEIFSMSPQEVHAYVGDVYPMYSHEIVAGNFAKSSRGPIRVVEIRTPLSTYPNNSYNQAFVSVCY